jgi:hypothetical protein
MDSLTEDQMKGFIQRCIELLHKEYPTWTEGKPIKEREDFVKETITCLQEHEVHYESNIQQILRCRVKHNFSINLPPELKARLSPNTIDENYRVHRFINFLKKSGKKRISLNDNLEALRREYV